MITLQSIQISASDREHIVLFLKWWKVWCFTKLNINHSDWTFSFKINTFSFLPFFIKGLKLCGFLEKHTLQNIWAASSHCFFQVFLLFFPQQHLPAIMNFHTRSRTDIIILKYCFQHQVWFQEKSTNFRSNICILRFYG